MRYVGPKKPAEAGLSARPIVQASILVLYVKISRAVDTPHLKSFAACRYPLRSPRTFHPA